MIVWGGYDQFPWPETYFTAGGRYDPVTDTWHDKSMATAGEPTARAGHGAIWTGNEMIVWGGSTDLQQHATGARYDPKRNRWTATSTSTGTPAAGTPKAVLWTGKEMMVWGFADLNGARYEPTSDVWTGMATEGGPIGFGDGVWTGTEVLWWGYQDRRYDLAQNRWSVLAGEGRPSARGNSTTVWTGSEMILWGGQGPDYPWRLKSGARYDPERKAWAPTSEGTGVPPARLFHSAVWTGTHMLVWGGLPVTSSGGAYCAPQSGDDSVPKGSLRSRLGAP
jgi:hypothetical protein